MKLVHANTVLHLDRICSGLFCSPCISSKGGEAVNSQTPEVSYPNGLEYRCNSGFSTNGAASGPTKIGVRVNSVGGFTPALPAECKKIVFNVNGGVKNSRSGSFLSGVKVTARLVGGGAALSINTRSNGYFTLAGVGPGEYDFEYEKSGLITVTRKFIVAWVQPWGAQGRRGLVGGAKR